MVGFERPWALFVVLGRRGVPIMVGSHGSLGMSAYCRYARVRFTYPRPVEDLDAAHAMVIERVRTRKPDILMPVFDEDWSIIHEFYHDYASLTTIVPNPGRKLYNHLSDKSCLADCATRNGIEIPKTFNPGSLEEAINLRAILPYPVLLKPKKSVRE